MKDCQIVDAVYEHAALHPLTPLRGLKEQARVRLRVWLAEGTEDKTTGLAALCGGWEGSDAWLHRWQRSIVPGVKHAHYLLYKSRIFSTPTRSRSC